MTVGGAIEVGGASAGCGAETAAKTDDEERNKSIYEIYIIY